MRKLGLVGGIGPESTVMYYRGVIEGVQEAVGKESYPQMSIESIDMPHMLELCALKDYTGLSAYILEAIRSLAATGADFAALASNTPHIVFDDVVERSPLPLVSIVVATAEEAQARGVKRVGLLGTGFTMKESFYQDAFARLGIEMYVPSAEEQVFINEKIFSELEYGIVKQETREAFLAIVADMQTSKDIEAVVLGCTELPLLFDGANVPLPTLDTAKLHIAALVREVLVAS